MAEGAASRRQPTKQPTRSKDAARAKLAIVVGVVVTLIWATSALAGLFTGDYQGLEVVSPVMVIFSGYIFGINIVRTGEKSSAASRRRR